MAPALVRRPDLFLHSGDTVYADGPLTESVTLADGINRSTATWKLVQADLPIGLVVPDGTGIEGVANAPAGREAELTWVLGGIRRVPNVVWLTADVHYTAAHHYSPDRAAFTDFRPFWEFVSGPLHAGAFGPNALDPTFAVVEDPAAGAPVTSL